MQTYKSIISLRPRGAWALLPSVARRAICAMDCILWMRRVRRSIDGNRYPLISEFQWAMRGHFKNGIPTSVVYCGQKWSIE